VIFKATVQRSWTVYKRHFVTFAAVEAFFVYTPNLILANLAPASGILSGVALLIVFVLMLLGYMTIVVSAFHILRDQPIFLQESMRVSCGGLLPAFAVGVVSLVCMLTGLALCLFPGCWAIAAWAVAVPACAVERTGVISSFKRSAHLTAGKRWETLGAMLGISVIAFAALLVPGKVLGHGNPTHVIAEIALTALISAFFAVFSATLYHDPRAFKDGLAAQDIAGVFD